MSQYLEIPEDLVEVYVGTSKYDVSSPEAKAVTGARS
jgi:hypothetical protein